MSCPVHVAPTRSSILESGLSHLTEILVEGKKGKYSTTRKEKEQNIEKREKKEKWENLEEENDSLDRSFPIFSLSSLRPSFSISLHIDLLIPSFTLSYSFSVFSRFI